MKICRTQTLGTSFDTGTVELDWPVKYLQVTNRNESASVFGQLNNRQHNFFRLQPGETLVFGRAIYITDLCFKSDEEGAAVEWIALSKPMPEQKWE